MNQNDLITWARLYDLAAGLYLQEPTADKVTTLVSLADVIGERLDDEALSRLLFDTLALLTGDILLAPLLQQLEGGEPDGNRQD